MCGCIKAVHTASLAGLVSGNSSDASGGRIWGSADAGDSPRFRYTFFTQLLVNKNDGSSELCGGTLIKSNVVLTAAHCLYDYDNVHSVGIGIGHDLRCGPPKQVKRYDNVLVTNPDLPPDCTSAYGTAERPDVTKTYVALLYPDMRAPPGRLGANYATLTDGAYSTSSSSNASSAFMAFNDASGEPWVSAAGEYDGAGAYIGSAMTATVGGAWVQLSAPVAFALIAITVRTNAKTLKIMGSNDTVTWAPARATLADGSTSYTITVTNTAAVVIYPISHVLLPHTPSTA